jgi:hypothetical protein
VADDQTFPTAIIPTRPVGIECRYDALAEQFGDPVVKMFRLANGAEDERVQLQAASELMSYRYTKPKAAPDIAISTGGGGLVINIGAPPADPAMQAIDVTPSAPSPQDGDLEEMLK